MKIGIFLSAAVVILFVMLLLLNRGEPATRPTSDTAPQMLAMVALPSSAPPLFTPASPDTNGDEAYHKALGFFESSASALYANTVNDEMAKAWAALFIDAADAGKVSDGFLDKQTPMIPVPRGPFTDALGEAPRVILTYAQSLFDKGEKDKAIQIGRAMWAMGLRGFTHNTRARERFLSLYCMEMAHDALRAWLPEDGDDARAIKAWGDYILAAGKTFNKKTEILMTVSPNIGDMVRMAGQDQDPTFRIEATLKLGVLQHNPKNKANLKLMSEVFAFNKKDTHPGIAAAAAAAEKLTIEDIRKLR